MSFNGGNKGAEGVFMCTYKGTSMQLVLHSVPEPRQDLKVLCQKRRMFACLRSSVITISTHLVDPSLSL